MIGAVLALMIAATAFRAGALSASGAAAAIVVGAIVFDIGGPTATYALLTFFLTSTLLGRWRRSRKEGLAFEKGTCRDAGQVLANGGVAALCLVAGYLHPEMGPPAHLACLAAIAAANADTWATEIGAALDAPARLITTFRTVPAGTSGAVSLPGTLAAAAGALAVAAWSPQMTIVALAGFAGSIVDSVAGATIQAAWTDPNDPGRLRETPTGRGVPPKRGLSFVGNDAVNWLCTASAAALAFWLS